MAGTVCLTGRLASRRDTVVLLTEYSIAGNVKW
jgi:hypothetical protein